MKTRSGAQVSLEDSFVSADSDPEIEMVNFDVENGTDDPGAQAKMGSIKTTPGGKKFRPF